MTRLLALEFFTNSLPAIIDNGAPFKKLRFKDRSKDRSSTWFSTENRIISEFQGKGQSLGKANRYSSPLGDF